MSPEQKQFSRTETIVVTSNLVVVLPQPTVQLTITLPWVTEDVWLRRMSVMTDRGAPAATELPLFTKSFLTSSPPTLNWARFTQCRTKVYGLGTAAAFNRLHCNSVNDWVGRVQLIQPNQSFLLSATVDATGLAAGDNLVIGQVLEFEVF